jgi:hypothetical protein
MLNWCDGRLRRNLVARSGFREGQKSTLEPNLAQAE